MHRTRVTLGDEHYRFLHAEARRLGVSVAEVIRRLVSERMRAQGEPSADLFEELAGAAEGDGFSGRDHDRVLYGDPRR